MKLSPLCFINSIRNSDKYIETIYTNGGCYNLYLVLKELFPNAIPVINENNDHAGSLINGVAYDIYGVVDWHYRVMDIKDIDEARKWSFCKANLIQIGECPVCEEPLVI